MGAERALVGGWPRLARMGQKTGRPGNPKLDDETWVALLERYVRGETQAALGLDYGVSVSAVAWQARQRGYRKKDRPDAVYRWVQPPPIVAAAPADVACGFHFDPDDLERRGRGGCAGTGVAGGVSGWPSRGLRAGRAKAAR